MLTALRHGGRIAWGLFLGFLGAAAASMVLLTDTVELRYARDVNRMVFNDNVQVLDEIRARLGQTADSLATLLSTPARTDTANSPYIVVSLAENMLWYKLRDSILFSAPVATGSGKVLVSGSGGSQWRFETPRGRLAVQEKDEDPAWVPPDWHFVETARKKGIGTLKLNRGDPVSLKDGSQLTVQGTDVVKRFPDGRTQSVGEAKEGRELVVDGKLVIPPFGTNQRRYMGVLGTRRLSLGDGYAIHGTNNPSSIGRSVSHGCIRMRNEDIEQLFPMVAIGTPVYVY
jgi:hypothetical protein